MNMAELEEKRLNFSLNPDSTVLNIGGYTGVWASKLYSKYNCNMYIYEPVPSFFNILQNNFKDKSNVYIFNYGVLDKDIESLIEVNEDGTSLYGAKGNTLIKLVDILNILNNFQKIDLMEINVEGSEYSIINRINNIGQMNKIDNFLVQFHKNIPDYEKKLDSCREILNKTHTCLWNCDYVFECWKRN